MVQACNQSRGQARRDGQGLESILLLNTDSMHVKAKRHLRESREFHPPHAHPARKTYRRHEQGAREYAATSTILAMARDRALTLRDEAFTPASAWAPQSTYCQKNARHLSRRLDLQRPVKLPGDRRATRGRHLPCYRVAASAKANHRLASHRILPHLTIISHARVTRSGGSRAR